MSTAEIAKQPLTGPLGTILSCRTYGDVKTKVLESTATHLDCSSGVFFQFLQVESDSPCLSRHSFAGDRFRAVDTYVGHSLYRSDPCFNQSRTQLRSRPDPSGFHVLRLSAITGWRNSSYHANFLKPFDIGDVLGLVIPVCSPFEKALMCVAFQKRSNEADFTAEDVIRLKALAPSLDTVLTNLAYADALSLSNALVNALADDADATGFVVLDDDLCIRHANREGLFDLGLINSDGATAPTQSDVFGAIRQRLLFAISCEICDISFNIDATDLAVKITTFNNFLGDKYHLVITMNGHNQQRLSRLCSACGLSTREAQVATLVCAGQSNASIAGQLSIAVRTVENHLRSIFQKAAVTSRAQLISKMIAARR